MPTAPTSEGVSGRQFATRLDVRAGQPVLWPEHFDLAIDVDEVNYGVSPGDGYHGAPYAYVGPWLSLIHI